MYSLDRASCFHPEGAPALDPLTAAAEKIDHPANINRPSAALLDEQDRAWETYAVQGKESIDTLLAKLNHDYPKDQSPCVENFTLH
jgi:hypothetical protein